MSAALNPFGLRPVRHRSGRVFAQAIPDGIASGYATDLYKGTPVAIDTNGHVVIAANGSDFVGAFAGVEYTDALGVRQFANRWVANTVATEVVAYVYSDPGIIYEVQADGSLPQAATGDEADFSAGAGNAIGDGDSVTQLSKAAASATLKGVGIQGMLRVLSKSLDPANDFGDAFTVVEVEVARHQYVAAKTAV